MEGVLICVSLLDLGQVPVFVILDILSTLIVKAAQLLITVPRQMAVVVNCVAILDQLQALAHAMQDTR